MGGIRDHEQEIYDLIRYNPSVKWGVNKVARALRMQLNKVEESYLNLTASGLLTRHERDKDWPYPYYTPNPDLIEDYLGFRENSAELYEKIITKYLKKLKRKKIFVNIKRVKRKKIFVNIGGIKLKQGGTTLGYKRAKNAKADFESFKGNLKHLIAITSTLPFAQVLGIIPKKPKYDKMIIKNQRKVLATAKKLIDQLYNDHKDQKDVIQSDLKWSLPVLEELQRMPNYFESKKKS